MGAKWIGWTGSLLVVLALLAAACGGSGGDDHECRICQVSEDCKSDQDCALAIDGELRCFKQDENSCKVDRVPVARATPLPTATPGA